jgi:hypothetical protein
MQAEFHISVSGTASASGRPWPPISGAQVTAFQPPSTYLR